MAGIVGTLTYPHSPTLILMALRPKGGKPRRRTELATEPLKGSGKENVKVSITALRKVCNGCFWLGIPQNCGHPVGVLQNRKHIGTLKAPLIDLSVHRTPAAAARDFVDGETTNSWPKSSARDIRHFTAERKDAQAT